MTQTPMMRQWSQIKAAYPDCIVLFRLGDFYEAFNEDASVVADVCDVVLTSRPVKKGERAPMAGVPYHSVDGYIAQLVRRGLKVAIAEQTGHETSPEKRARMSRRPTRPVEGLPASPKAKILEREVVRVVTPGTLVEGDLIDERANNFLSAVVHSGDAFGLASADVTTGEFTATVIHSGEPLRKLVDELVRLSPAELLLPATEDEPDDGLGGALRHALELHGLPTILMPYADWRFDVANARRVLLEHFGVASLDAYGCENEPLAASAAGAVLAYLQETQQGAIAQITALRTYSTDSYMLLDAATRRNLELVSTIRGDKRRGTLLWVLDHSSTALGGRQIRRWLDQPLLQPDQIELRLDGVETLVVDGMLRAELASVLETLPDLERLTNRIVAGYAGPREVLALGRALRALPALAELLAGIENPPAVLRDRCRQDLTTLSAEIERALPDDPPATLGVMGAIRAGYDTELDGIHASVADAREWIAALQEVERRRTGIAKLKVGYNKVFGYYLAVPKSQSEHVPEDYIRKQTLVDSERYITPELKEKESEVLHAEERIVAIERRLFARLTEQVAARANELLEAATDIAVVDALCSLAQVAVEHRYARPRVDDSRSLRITGGRHPVVELMRPEHPFVPNDIEVRDGEILLLTGPNMAGKSTVGRQVALITLMAQVGSFVPAQSASIGLVDRIFTRIGAQDEIAAGQSTFMVEMTETAGILHHATDRSLIILDELGRGTSTYDGIAIAWAVIEHIHNHPRLGARTLFATHYHELTALEDLLPRVRNISMAVTETEEGVTFLHKVVPGAADRSYGVHVAELAGLPADVVARAWIILRRLEAEGNVPLQGAGDRPPLTTSVQASGTAAEAAKAGVQLSMFAPLEREHPVLKRLRGLDVDGLTPMEAIVMLYELRRQLDEEFPPA
jgi:DNA mismatch repair protein MutS